MKKIIYLIFASLIFFSGANAYQLMSSKELGNGEAKNQNVVVKCTTDTGKQSTQTCKFRRYAKCSGTGSNKKCNGWQEWKDLQSPSKEYNSWQAGASDCCGEKGLR